MTELWHLNSEISKAEKRRKNDGTENLTVGIGAKHSHYKAIKKKKALKNIISYQKKANQ